MRKSPSSLKCIHGHLSGVLGSLRYRRYVPLLALSACGMLAVFSVSDTRSSALGINIDIVVILS